MRLSSQGQSERGFTLVELLVVVSIIALLLSMLLPSLRKARESAKSTVCQANLSGFGKGFATYAGGNEDYLCSGSVDPEVDNGRDGPIDQVGWIADLVNGGYGRPSEALCPSNAARVNQKLGQGISGCFGKVFPNGDSYATWQLIDKRIERGYNSNYTQSWYMARTQMRGDYSELNVKKLSATLGPLRWAELLAVSAARVPLMGDGGIEAADRYGGELDFGTQTVKTMTDGPIEPFYGPQDYSDFGPAHGFGKRISGQKASNRDRANILFADCHVSQFIDKVRDGEFNLVLRDDGEFVQQDVDPQVFDGVITLGRRSRDHFTLR